MFQLMQEMIHLMGLTGVSVVSGSIDTSMLRKINKDSEFQEVSQGG